MDSYVLVGSRDPDAPDSRRCYDLAGALADGGAEVTVFLVQNGVLAARRASAGAEALSGLAGRTTVVADDFSCASGRSAPPNWLWASAAAASTTSSTQ